VVVGSSGWHTVPGQCLSQAAIRVDADGCRVGNLPSCFPLLLYSLQFTSVEALWLDWNKIGQVPVLFGKLHRMSKFQTRTATIPRKNGCCHGSAWPLGLMTTYAPACFSLLHCHFVQRSLGWTATPSADLESNCWWRRA
jgi:hypothetical protein